MHRRSPPTLEAHGEFHPFGATLSADGEVGAVGASTGEEFPPGAELAQVLINAFQSQFAEGAIVAVALATNVDIPSQFDPEFPDGIRVTIGCEGYSRHVYLPYRLSQQMVCPLETVMDALNCWNSGAASCGPGHASG